MAIQRADLAAQALAGETGAWNALIQRHNRRVIVSLLARGVPLELALNLAQEAWARLVQQQASGKLTRLDLPGLAVAQARFLALTGWAGLWMRVDGQRSRPSLAFDNMQDRPVRGSTDWKRYEVVLDVADEATGVALGILLDGTGAVWMSDVKVETVDKTVATTGGANRLHDEPVNLDFTR
jgi:hypothetical protein